MGQGGFSAGGALSRRRFFGLGASTVGMAAVLAACGSDEPPAPGRVGNAPEETDLPDEVVDDVVLLRTLTSLEHSIVAVYDQLADIEGLDQDVVALLGRFSDDHVATAGTFAELTSASRWRALRMPQLMADAAHPATGPRPHPRWHRRRGRDPADRRCGSRLSGHRRRPRDDRCGNGPAVRRTPL